MALDALKIEGEVLSIFAVYQWLQGRKDFIEGRI